MGYRTAVLTDVLRIAIRKNLRIHPGKDCKMAEIFRINAHTWGFEDGFVRFFLLEGEEKAVLIDSGVNCPNAAELAKTLTDKPLLLLNTHGDGDHTSATAAFSEIHMHPLDYYGCGVQERYPKTALAEVKDGDCIELGNRPLRLIHIPGHTCGSIAILDIRERVLYAGDSVQKGYVYMFGDKRDPKQYGASLDKLAAMSREYDFIYASHDEFLLPNDYAGKVRKAWQQVLDNTAAYEVKDLFGNKVKAYFTEFCGFYME